MAKTEKFVDESGAEYEFAVRADNVLPILEKSWTGIIATANNSGGSGCDFILGEFNVDTTNVNNWVLEVEIEAKYIASDWSNNNATSNHVCHVEGYRNATICYSMWNNIRSTTYRPFYNFIVYIPSSSSGKFYFGICLYNCNKNTTTSNSRSVSIRVRRATNISNLALHEEPAATDYTTYYVNMSARSAYDCYNNGLRESGDDNSTTNIYARDITGYCSTSAGTAAKYVDYGQFDYTDSKVFKVYFGNTNTESTPTLNVNNQGAKPIYLLTGDNTWVVADATNKTITAGSHWVYYVASKFYILPDACNSSSISTDNAFVVGQASYAVKNVFASGVFLAKGGTFRIYICTTNTNTGDLSLNVNISGAKPIYLDGTRCNGTTKNLVGGKWYDVVYDGTQYNAYSDAGTIVYPKATNADTATRSNTTALADFSMLPKYGSANYSGISTGIYYTKVFQSTKTKETATDALFDFGYYHSYTKAAPVNYGRVQVDVRFNNDGTVQGIYGRHLRMTSDSNAGFFATASLSSNTVTITLYCKMTQGAGLYQGVKVWLNGKSPWSAGKLSSTDTFYSGQTNSTTAPTGDKTLEIPVVYNALASDITSAINALDKSDTAVAGQVVSAVSETDGKITVSRRALVADDIPNIDASKVDGVVTISGTQTISGTKTFSSTTYSTEFRSEKTVSGVVYDTAWRIGSNGKAYLRFKKTDDESQDEWNLIEATHDSKKSVKVNGTWSFANEIGGTVEKAVCDADGSTLSEFLKGQTDAELSGIEQTPYSGISLTEYTSVARSDSSGKLVTRHRSLTIPQHGAFAILVSTENERTVRSSTTIALNLGNPFVIPAYGDCVLSVTLVWKNADGSISPQTLRRVQLRVGATSDWDSLYGYREVDVLTGEKTTVIIKVVNQTDVSNNCFVFAKTMDGNNIVAGAGDISGTCIFGKGFAIDATPDES